MCKAVPIVSLRIDGPPKGRPVTIRVDGREVAAHEGESLYAALTAAGITGLSEDSFGRPTGALCGMGVCYQCRATIDGVPDRRACMAAVENGMQIQTGRPDQGERDDA